jgi:hypothetical protein
LLSDSVDVGPLPSDEPCLGTTGPKSVCHKKVI